MSMTLHRLKVDRSVAVRVCPSCHTRWHPEIPAALCCDSGDIVEIDTRDAVDGQFTMDSSHRDVTRIDRSIVHPLTGPIFVRGARPGDVLAVETLDVVTSAFGYTAQIPGFGLLRDEFPEPFLIRWEITGLTASSPDLPGVALRGAPFLGVIGVAPSPDLLRVVNERESALADAAVALPAAEGAVPASPEVALHGWRTQPPRETGGNLDIRQLVAGTTLYLPVHVDGALLSVGDGHFAQGDGEVCGTAVETATVARVRVVLHSANNAAPLPVPLSFVGVSSPHVSHQFVATTGLSMRSEDLTESATQAVRKMVDLLTAERGLSRRQAYALCSVAADLSVSQAVDLPAVAVTATLNLDVFAA